jgi:hypothetical protein
MLRREFILNDLARIFRTAFFGRRINTIATTTWLFEPDNIPQNIPPPAKKIKLKGLPRIVKAFTTYFYHQLANMNYHRTKTGIGKRSPLTSAWYYYEWNFYNNVHCRHIGAKPLPRQEVYHKNTP